MIRIFKHYIPHSILMLGVVDLVVLLLSAEIGWVVRIHQIGSLVSPVTDRIPQLMSFAIALQCAMIAVGVYGVEALRSLRFAAARLLAAVSLGLILIAVMFFLFPELTLWRSNAIYSMVIAFFLLCLTRLALGGFFSSDALKRRILLLGAGVRASRVMELAAQPGASFVVVGCIAMNETNQMIPNAIPRSEIASLAEHVEKLAAGEVVLALDERRNAVPLHDLLRVKTTGVHVNEISTFLERETGRVDLDSVRPSWLIFSDGFTYGQRLSLVIKRAFDIIVSLLLLIFAAPVIVITAILIRLESAGSPFYRQERVGRYGEPFLVVKLRSMRQDAEIGGKAIWASEDDPRVTRVGRVIRLIRFDELPQIWNVLKGDMSFVGPRPERPVFVSELETQITYYAERHMMKPGITGWAQINYPYGASLEDARNKLEYDLYYAKNYSLFLDMLILLQTVRVLIWAEGAR